jgi:hypothetical protein
MVCRSSSTGLVLTITALLLQLAFGVAGGSIRVASDAVPARLQALSALLPGADILCHTDGNDGTGQSSPGHPGQQHHGDCAICPVCFAFAQPVAMLAAQPVLPQRLAVVVSLAAPPPPATAPPGLLRTSAQPRAPPVLT